MDFHSPLADTSTSTIADPPANPVVSNPFTGDYRIDTLLESLDYRWNHQSPLGTGVTVTYSFMTAKPTYGGTDDGDGDTGFQPFTTEQRAAVRQIFDRLEVETGLRFREVSDSDTSYGQVRFGNNTQQVSSGYAFLPYSTSSDLSGDVWIDDSIASYLTNLPPGSWAYATLVHEIGHALGLKHPGDYNAGEAATQTPGNYLGSLEDNTLYTIMSYRDAPGGLARDWYGIYDLLTLRTLYGAGSEGSGDTAYRYTDSIGLRMTTVYDAGGTDTLDLSGTTTSQHVDLRPGAFSSIGRQGGSAPDNNFSIDLATTIENYVGNGSSDYVTGNSAANRITLGGGSNEADGGAGIDTAVYSGAANSYRVSASSGRLTVSGNGATDTLTNVERLQFGDRGLAFDTNAQTAAKVIGAVFGPSSVSNAGYVGIGLSLLDGGMSYQQLMQLALNVRLGATASAVDVVTLLYTNVIGSAPGATELATFAGFITSGNFTPAALGVLAADHPLNQAHVNLVGIASTGLAFSA